MDIGTKTGLAPLRVYFCAPDYYYGENAQVQHLWDFGDGQTASTGIYRCTEHDYYKVGIFTVTVITRSRNWICPVVGPCFYTPWTEKTDTGKVVITGYEPQEWFLNIQASPKTGEAPLIVAVSVIPSINIGYARYEWSFGDGQTSLTTDGYVIHTYQNPGTYQITVTAKPESPQYLDRQASIEIIVYEPGPVPAPLKALFQASTLFGTAPLFVRFFNISTGPIVSYKWDFGIAGAKAYTKDATYTFTQKGVYQVSLKVKDNLGNTDIASLAITVNGFPPEGNGGPPPPPSEEEENNKGFDLKSLLPLVLAGGLIMAEGE